MKFINILLNIFELGYISHAEEALSLLILVDEKEENIAPSLPFPITTFPTRGSFSSFATAK